MSTTERCDEIVRLIDEVLGDWEPATPDVRPPSEDKST